MFLVAKHAEGHYRVLYMAACSVCAQRRPPVGLQWISFGCFLCPSTHGRTSPWNWMLVCPLLKVTQLYWWRLINFIYLYIYLSLIKVKCILLFKLLNNVFWVHGSPWKILCSLCGTVLKGFLLADWSNGKPILVLPYPTKGQNAKLNQENSDGSELPWNPESVKNAVVGGICPQNAALIFDWFLAIPVSMAPLLR